MVLPVVIAVEMLAVLHAFACRRWGRSDVQLLASLNAASMVLPVVIAIEMLAVLHAFACRRWGRIDVQLLASLNGLLLSYGQELRPHIATLHKPLQQYVKLAWNERNLRLKVR
jgi:hypothetical protein